MLKLGNIPFIKNEGKNAFFLISGPCAVEGRDMVFDIAGSVSEICDRLEIPYIFKASYNKANRTKIDSFRGIGDEKALAILADVRKELKIPVLTDVHTVEEVQMAAEVVDVLQIPAFLCRQTDLLLAAAKTMKPINIKKGQFLSAESMVFAKEKVLSAGNDQIIMTERGTTFGYNDLVVDFRNIPKMSKMAATVLDCTHAVQRPNTAAGVTGGSPEMIETLAKAGIVTGANGIFIETHPNPSIAKSDGANMLALDKLEGLLKRLLLVKNSI